MKQFLSWILVLLIIPIALITFPFKIIFYTLCYVLAYLANSILQLTGTSVEATMDVSPPIKFKVKV